MKTAARNMWIFVALIYEYKRDRFLRCLAQATAYASSAYEQFRCNLALVICGVKYSRMIALDPTTMLLETNRPSQWGYSTAFRKLAAPGQAYSKKHLAHSLARSARSAKTAHARLTSYPSVDPTASIKLVDFVYRSAQLAGMLSINGEPLARLLQAIDNVANQIKEELRTAASPCDYTEFTLSDPIDSELVPTMARPSALKSAFRHRHPEVSLENRDGKVDVAGGDEDEDDEEEEQPPFTGSGAGPSRRRKDGSDYERDDEFNSRSMQSGPGADRVARSAASQAGTTDAGPGQGRSLETSGTGGTGGQSRHGTSHCFSPIMKDPGQKSTPQYPIADDATPPSYPHIAYERQVLGRQSDTSSLASPSRPFEQLPTAFADADVDFQSSSSSTGSSSLSSVEYDDEYDNDDDDVDNDNDELDPVEPMRRFDEWLNSPIPAALEQASIRYIWCSPSRMDNVLARMGDAVARAHRSTRANHPESDLLSRNSKVTGLDVDLHYYDILAEGDAFSEQPV